MTPQYPSLVFYDNGCMVGWMHECLKIGMYHLIPSIRSSSLGQIINGIFREICTPAIPSPFPPSPFPCLYIYISTCLLMYIIQVLERVIHSLSLLCTTRGERIHGQVKTKWYILFIFYLPIPSSDLPTSLHISFPFFNIHHSDYGPPTDS